MHPKSCPSIMFWKTSILICPFVYQHKECQHSDGEVPFGLITLGISYNSFLNPLKTKKVNIGSPEIPKFANIGDYWDDETIGKITDLQHEFQYLFPTKFLK